MRLEPIREVDVATPTGPMRTRLFMPQVLRPVPAVVLYSEIYQMTGPIARTAAAMAGHGYIVAVPDVYHEYTSPGECFAYDKAGTDRGNQLKVTKPVAQFDSDTVALLDALQKIPECNGSLASLGICLGGHLAFRTAFDPRVRCGVCFYATDIHSSTLGLDKSDDTIRRIGEIRGEMMMIWGRQDPHIPREGRQRIYDAMSDAGTKFTWHEFNGEHAFLRDEGHRYDPEIADIAMSMVYALFHRVLW